MIYKILPWIALLLLVLALVIPGAIAPWQAIVGLAFVVGVALFARSRR